MLTFFFKFKTFLDYIKISVQGKKKVCITPAFRQKHSLAQSLSSGATIKRAESLNYILTCIFQLCFPFHQKLLFACHLSMSSTSRLYQIYNLLSIWEAGTFFSPAPGSQLPAPGSRFYKFLLPSPTPNSSKNAQLLGAVFRVFYRLWLPPNKFNGSSSL